MEDSKLKALWEARNLKGEWQPIEYFHFSGCGNSHLHFLIPKASYILIIANYPEGDFLTEIRLKVRIGKNIYNSTEIKGSINRSQLALPASYDVSRGGSKEQKLQYYRYLFLDD